MRFDEAANEWAVQNKLDKVYQPDLDMNMNMLPPPISTCNLTDLLPLGFFALSRMGGSAFG